MSKMKITFFFYKVISCVPAEINAMFATSTPLQPVRINVDASTSVDVNQAQHIVS